MTPVYVIIKLNTLIWSAISPSILKVSSSYSSIMITFYFWLMKASSLQSVILKCI